MKEPETFEGRRIEFGGRVVHATRLEDNKAACGADLNAGYPEIPDSPVTCARCRRAIEEGETV